MRSDFACRRCGGPGIGRGGWCASCRRVEEEREDIRRRIVQTRALLGNPRNAQHRAALEARLSYLVTRQTILSGDEEEVRRHNEGLTLGRPLPTPSERERRRARVRLLRSQGMSMDDIARALRIGHTTVSRDLNGT
jgi:hypothetical protein